MNKITPKEIVAHLKSTNPKLSNLKDGQSAALIREAFKLISQVVVDTHDDVVRIAGLGSFRAKNVERDKDGVKTTVERVIFRPAKKKSDKV